MVIVRLLLHRSEGRRKGEALADLGEAVKG